MLDPCFPPFSEAWPDAGLGVEGLRGRMIKCNEGRVVLMEADEDVLVPRHQHGAQWGVVLAGRMDVTIGDEKRTYPAGQTHFIPAGVEHEARLYAGWRGLYVFARDARPLIRGEE